MSPIILVVKRSYNHRLRRGFFILSGFGFLWIVLVTYHYSLLQDAASTVSFRSNREVLMDMQPRKGLFSWWLSCSQQQFIPTIDIVASGSVLRYNYLQAQAETFGSHRFVRDYYPISELNDTDKSCALELTLEKRQKVVDFCTFADNKTQTYETYMFRIDLFGPIGPTSWKPGWLCAQKRPIDGLHYLLERYKSQVPIPDYVMVIDDDTFLNIDLLVKTFRKSYPPHESHLVAGCTFRQPREVDLVFPVGGLGSYLTRAAIEKIMMPIFCKGNDVGTQDAFTRWACWRLEQDPVGEKSFFVDGMSIGDLMYAYASGLPYTRVDEWKRTGFCFHSDHTLGYFFNYYHVAVPDRILQQTNPSDEIRKRYSFKAIAGSREIDHSGRGGECDNLWKLCNRKNRICHYTNPEQMRKIYKRQNSFHPYEFLTETRFCG